MIEGVAGQTEREVAARMCLALKPEKVSREDYDASPEGVRTALSRGAAAWGAACGP